VIRWRLEQTLQAAIQDDLIVDCALAGAYASSADLETEVSLLLDAIGQSPGKELFSEEITTWLDRIRIFGLCLARLDIRQDARQYRDVLNELLQKMDLCANPEALDELERQEILISTFGVKMQAPVDGLSEAARETLDLFRLLHRVVDSYGPQTLGGHVVSMTHAPSDILTILWLWQQTTLHRETNRDDDAVCRLPIIPLFETIEDLQQGPAILAGILAVPAYREQLRQQGDRQTVMLGYSDSTKDGGYLSACWSLYRAQQQLQAVATEHDIELIFFHGRGGSLGRGGGPAARSILSLPNGTFRGSLRLTEQGEVLADRYDDPNIAQRHLEQVVWSSLLASSETKAPDREDWVDIIERLEDASYRTYRDLVEQPEFVKFFRQATPITEVEQMPIGSRPARRQSSNSLADLRAIPWVFSWTQCRCLIPAWYGFGAAADQLLQDDQSRQLLQSMYRDWPFFRATVDNAELALAKTDLGIAEQYANLTDESDALARIGSLISEEFLRTRNAILAITENEDLLDGTPWLKESVRVRNRYIDPLNLIQIELLRRSRNCAAASEEKSEELRHLLRLTINGLAAGMRTSG
jgi:phosphoenolpyruvate carboxylase